MGNIRLLSDMENIQQDFYVDFPEETNYRKDLGYWYKKVSVIGNVLEIQKETVWNPIRLASPDGSR